MRVTIVEGTPDEIARAFPHLTADGQSRVAAVDAGNASEIAEDENEVSYVSVEIARLVLHRLKLSKVQRIVLKTLYQAFPSLIPTAELQQKVGYTPSQFRGLMGAFGRRLSHTEGYVEGTWFFIQEWDNDERSYRYGLPETVREAMRLENIV